MVVDRRPVFFTCRLTPSMHEAITAESTKHGISKSDFVKWAVQLARAMTNDLPPTMRLKPVAPDPEPR